MAGESARDSARRMREKSERLARSAELWERGAEGERATAAALDALPKGEWTVFHDVRWPGRQFANVDHVAVGPSGVFVIDSKNWSGRIEVTGQTLRQNGRSREKAVNGTAEAALAVAGLTRAVPPQQVFPVMCFVRDQPVAGWARDVMLCSTQNLVDMLVTRPRVIEAPTRRLLCLDLDASLRAASAPVSGRGSSHVPRTRRGSDSVPRQLATARPPARPHRRRARRSDGLLQALLVVVAVLAVFVSPLPTAFGQWFASRVAGTAAVDQPERPARGVTNEDVAGTWSGTYLCSSTRAEGHLVMRAVRQTTTDLSGVFRFGPTAESPDVKSGSYRMVGTVSEGHLTLTPGEWIERPSGYSAVGLTATITEERPMKLQGEVPGCTSFSFTRE